MTRARQQFSPQVQAEINKRMTMNMFVQGAACHAQLTAHHYERERLDGLLPNVVSLLGKSPRTAHINSTTHFYDVVSAGLLMSQWNSEIAFITGFHSRFWRRTSARKTMFRNHPLLVQYGEQLANASKESTRQRCQEKGIRPAPLDLTLDLAVMLPGLIEFEMAHQFELVAIAIDITTAVWGIDENLLRAELTETPEFGDVRTPRTARGRILRKAMVGWSGVQTDAEGNLHVVAKSKYWILLLHELTKGTMELISLHGLNEIDSDTYQIVMEEADQIEFEVWMMQSGLELYRRFLKSVPRNVAVPAAFMAVARMPADQHQCYSFALMQDSESASQMLAESLDDQVER